MDNGEEVDLAVLAKAFLRIRRRIEALKAAHDEEVEGLTAAQKQLKHAMKAKLQSSKAKSVVTQEGTVILTESTRYSASDWDSFKSFCREHEGAMDLFEKRIAQGNMATWLKEHPESMPAGLNSETSIDVSVRSPKKEAA